MQNDHRRGREGQTPLRQITHRTEHAMLSVLEDQGGTHNIAERPFQATLSKTAVVLASNPSLKTVKGLSAKVVQDMYAFGDHGISHPLWVAGNSPPGDGSADIRPGWWQGDGIRPTTARSATPSSACTTRLPMHLATSSTSTFQSQPSTMSRSKTAGSLVDVAGVASASGWPSRTSGRQLARGKIEK